MEYTKIMSEIRSMFVKGAGCTVVVNKSADSSMNKGRGTNRNPFLGRVTIRKTYSGYVMGTDYSNSLLNTAERMGNKDAEVNLKKNWHIAVDEWFSTDRKTMSKFYLKLQRNEKQVACKVITEYFVGGRAATPQEVVEIEGWLKNKSNTQSSTQVEMGIDKAHEQHFFVPQLDTIICIKQGGKVWFPKPSFSLTEVEVAAPIMVTTDSKG